VQILKLRLPRVSEREPRLLVLYAGGSDDIIAVRTLTRYIRIVNITSVLVAR
jgi:hypothetical protein